MRCIIEGQVDQMSIVTADHLHNEDVELLQLEKDLFIGNRWWFNSLEFVRDKNNVHNLLFQKAE